MPKKTNLSVINRIAEQSGTATTLINQDPRRMVSLEDVAKLAGVSTGTVSRSLSKPQMISEPTRLRVLEAVDRLGYLANGAARALALRKTQTVGALVPRFGSSSFPKLVQEMETVLAGADYTLLLASPDHQRWHTEAPNILRALLQRGVDAVALLGAEHPPAVFALLEAHSMPFVLLWAQSSPQGVCVGFDETLAAALAVRHLHDLGHRRIGFVGGQTSENERARRRINGVLQAMAGCEMTLVAEATLETDYGFREGFDAMQAILAKTTSVTAMVFGNDYLAAGALAALDQADVSVPRDMSIISFNDNDFAPFLHPPLTTVRIPIGQIGEVAAHYLLQRMEGLQPVEPPLICVDLVIRSSTGPAPLL